MKWVLLRYLPEKGLDCKRCGWSSSRRPASCEITYPTSQTEDYKTHGKGFLSLGCWKFGSNQNGTESLIRTRANRGEYKTSEVIGQEWGQWHGDDDWWALSTKESKELKDQYPAKHNYLLKGCARLSITDGRPCLERHLGVQLRFGGDWNKISGYVSRP